MTPEVGSADGDRGSLLSRGRLDRSDVALCSVVELAITLNDGASVSNQHHSTAHKRIGRRSNHNNLVVVKRLHHRKYSSKSHRVKLVTTAQEVATTNCHSRSKLTNSRKHLIHHTGLEVLEPIGQGRFGASVGQDNNLAGANVEARFDNHRNPRLVELNNCGVRPSKRHFGDVYTVRDAEQIASLDQNTGANLPSSRHQFRDLAGRIVRPPLAKRHNGTSV